MRRLGVPPSIPLVLTLVSGLAFPQEGSRAPDGAAGPSGLAGPVLLSPLDLYREDSRSDRSEAMESAAVSSPASAGITPFPPGIGPLFTSAGDGDGGFRSWYIEGKAGPFWFSRNFTDLNPGLDTEGVLGVHLIRFLAIEAQSGYLWSEDSTPGSYSQLWAVPIVGNLKLTVPLFIVEPYVGAGGGAFYINTTERRTGVFSDTERDWVGGGNAFAGLNLTLGPLLIGAEAKYILTEKAKTARGRAELEGLAIMASLGIRW